MIHMFPPPLTNAEAENKGERRNHVQTQTVTGSDCWGGAGEG